MSKSKRRVSMLFVGVFNSLKLLNGGLHQIEKSKSNLLNIMIFKRRHKLPKKMAESR